MWCSTSAACPAATPDPAYAHTLVVNYGGLEPARLEETVSLLEAAFSED